MKLYINYLSIFFLLSIGCASSIRTDPTPAVPWTGCIYPTTTQQAHVQGRLLPEPVHIIGEYSADSWMVVRGTYLPKKCNNLWDREQCKWLPMAKDSIKLLGCGSQINTLWSAEH